MLERTSIFALAAVAALGVTALATSSASARAGGPVGMHGPMGVSVKPHGPMGVSLKPNKPVVTGLIINRKPPMVTGIIIHPKPHWPHHHWCKWHSCGPNWVIGGGVGVVATGVVASTAVAAAAPAPCTCLTKNYLQDGSVLFKDVCTTETAIAPSDQKAAN